MIREFQRVKPWNPISLFPAKDEREFMPQAWPTELHRACRRLIDNACHGKTSQILILACRVRRKMMEFQSNLRLHA
jgi:hypothetical protein